MPLHGADHRTELIYTSIDAKESVDIQLWERHTDVSLRTDHFNLLLYNSERMAKVPIFIRKLEKFWREFKISSSILELGGGNCWASYAVKMLLPNAYVFCTDIAPGAVENSEEWKLFFRTGIDGACACKSYEIPVHDESFDLVFCFQAAHHFWKHKRTLKEVNRILKPGGSAIYMDEPGCQSYIYKLAHNRVRSKRPEVFEDVLVYKNIVSISQELGMSVDVTFDPHLINRGPKETLYYYLLNRVPILRTLLPCTVDILFKKPS